MTKVQKQAKKKRLSLALLVVLLILAPAIIMLVISPVDFRVSKAPEASPTNPSWLPDLYAKIKVKLFELALPTPKSAASSSQT
jgi:hypothetical protein